METTQYLYEYQDGNRVRNIGFMKIDNQMDKSTIQIYARPMDEVKGILFQRPNGETYIGAWEAEASEMPLQPSQDMRPEPSAPLQQLQDMRPQPSEVPQQPSALQVPQQPSTSPQSVTPPQPQQPPQGPISPGPREELAMEPASVLDDVTEYITPTNVTYEKIKRQDLSRLPRKEWRLANNSFLLHGFYNYHHLLYIEEDGQIWIGVPGVYHPKEKMAANSFGFPEFKRISDVDVDLEEQERNTIEDFGYWCRQIPNS